MHMVIVGAGSIGSSLIEMAAHEDNDIVVIEQDPAIAHRIGDDFDCRVIDRDATDRETLLEARAKRTDVVISTTDEDTVNMMVMMLAREMGCESLVSVVHKKENIELFRTLGVNVVENPQRLIAEYIYRAVRRPSIKDFMRVGDTAEVFEIVVAEDAPIAGKTLEEADMGGLLPRKTITVAIDRTGEIIVPRGETVVEPHDHVTVFSDSGATDDILTSFVGSTADSPGSP